MHHPTPRLRRRQLIHAHQRHQRLQNHRRHQDPIITVPLSQAQITHMTSRTLTRIRPVSRHHTHHHDTRHIRVSPHLHPHQQRYQHGTHHNHTRVRIRLSILNAQHRRSPIHHQLHLMNRSLPRHLTHLHRHPRQRAARHRLNRMIAHRITVRHVPKHRIRRLIRQRMQHQSVQRHQHPHQRRARQIMIHPTHRRRRPRPRQLHVLTRRNPSHVQVHVTHHMAPVRLLSISRHHHRSLTLTVHRRQHRRINGNHIHSRRMLNQAHQRTHRRQHHLSHELQRATTVNRSRHTTQTIHRVAQRAQSQQHRRLARQAHTRRPSQLQHHPTHGQRLHPLRISQGTTKHISLNQGSQGTIQRSVASTIHRSPLLRHHRHHGTKQLRLPTPRLNAHPVHRLHPIGRSLISLGAHIRQRRRPRRIHPNRRIHRQRLRRLQHSTVRLPTHRLSPIRRSPRQIVQRQTLGISTTPRPRHRHTHQANQIQRQGRRILAREAQNHHRLMLMPQAPTQQHQLMRPPQQRILNAHHHGTHPLHAAPIHRQRQSPTGLIQVHHPHRRVPLHPTPRVQTQVTGRLRRTTQAGRHQATRHAHRQAQPQPGHGLTHQRADRIRTHHRRQLVHRPIRPNHQRHRMHHVQQHQHTITHRIPRHLHPIMLPHIQSHTVALTRHVQAPPHHAAPHVRVRRPRIHHTEVQRHRLMRPQAQQVVPLHQRRPQRLLPAEPIRHQHTLGPRTNVTGLHHHHGPGLRNPSVPLQLRPHTHRQHQRTAVSHTPTDSTLRRQHATQKT